MGSIEEAKTAISRLNGKRIGNRMVQVKYAKPRNNNKDKGNQGEKRNWDNKDKGGFKSKEKFERPDRQFGGERKERFEGQRERNFDRGQGQGRQFQDKERNFDSRERGEKNFGSRPEKGGYGDRKREETNPSKGNYQGGYSGQSRASKGEEKPAQNHQVQSKPVASSE